LAESLDPSKEELYDPPSDVFVELDELTNTYLELNQVIGI
jgi:hypothetical protein